MKCRIWLVRALMVVGLLLARPAAADEDPGVVGPYAVTVTSYGSYSTSIALGDISVIEVLAQVHYPTNLSNGPYPLVVMLHGSHSPCYDPGNPDALWSEWPCVSPRVPVPSYQGYDYAASLLASHGMIVVSISANGINAAENMSSNFGTTERAALIQYHLGKWSTFNSTGGSPFGTTFVGKVDLTRVGTMGHSRGGEAVISQYQLNASQGNPYGIKAIFPIAPVDDLGLFVNNVPVGVLLGYCDGDVIALSGVGYLDDARYSTETDATPKYTFLGMGANHAYFNRMWTPGQGVGAAFDDWNRIDPLQTDAWCGTSAPGNARLTATQQRGFSAAYMAAFFRRYLLGAKQFDNILKGASPPPPSAQTSLVYYGYFPGAFDRKDLNRLWISSDVTTNTLGGSVSQVGITPIPANAMCGGWTGVHCAGGWDPHFESLSALELGWGNTSASFTNDLPVYKRDVSNFGVLQFRVAVDHSDPRNAVGQAQDFRVKLADGAGHIVAVKASSYSGLLYYPPSVSGRPVMNTLRIPLSAFAGIDKTNVTSMSLWFDQKSQGDVIVSDFSFADEGTTTAEKWLVSSGSVVLE